jgi:hypothetical protein
MNISFSAQPGSINPLTTTVSVANPTVNAISNYTVKKINYKKIIFQ